MKTPTDEKWEKGEFHCFTTVNMGRGRWFNTYQEATDHAHLFLEKFPECDVVVIVEGPIGIIRRSDNHTDAPHQDAPHQDAPREDDDDPFRHDYRPGDY